MAAIDLAVLIIDPSIEAKIRAKSPPLTGDEVREVVLFNRTAEAAWEDHPVHGRRLVVRGETYAGRRLIAYLMPANEGDPEEGTFVLKTAMADPATG
jgi:hypothetical protein